MKSIVREQFLNRDWDAAHLDAAARFWVRLYEIASPQYGYPAIPRHRFEVRLWGGGQKEVPSLATELERRASLLSLPNWNVALVNPDTVVLASEDVDAITPYPTGLGLPLLVGPQFEGLAVEIRLRVTVRSSRFPTGGGRLGGHAVDVTLVISGEIRGGNLLAKAVWWSHEGRGEDDHYRTGPMPWDLKWVETLDQFKSSGAVTATELAALFAPPPPVSFRQRSTDAIVNVPFGRPRLAGLLVRCLLLGGLVPAIAAMLYRMGTYHEKVWSLPVLAAVLFGLPLCWFFLRTEFGYLASYRLWRDAHDGQHIMRGRFAVLTPEQSAKLDSDPAVRMHTADLLAEGFVLAGDVIAATETKLQSGYRIFLSRDGLTYLVLSYNFSLSWPAVISFQAQTFFFGGGRVDSVGPSDWYNYLAYPVGPHVLFRNVANITNPVQLYCDHATAVEAFTREKGLNPVRYERFEDYVRRQEEISDEEREYYADHPYSWWDHLRWYLQWPRREQRG